MTRQVEKKFKPLMKQLAALMGGMMKLNGASVDLMKTVNFRLSFRFLYVDGSLRVS